MTDTVGQRFLDGPVDAGAVWIRQGVEITGHADVDIDPVTPREIANVPLERRLQAEIVEHAGAQPEREMADGADHAVDQAAAFGDGGADAMVGSRSRALDAA